MTYQEWFIHERDNHRSPRTNTEVLRIGLRDLVAYFEDEASRQLDGADRSVYLENAVTAARFATIIGLR